MIFNPRRGGGKKPVRKEIQVTYGTPAGWKLYGTLDGVASLQTISGFDGSATFDVGTYVIFTTIPRKVTGATSVISAQVGSSITVYILDP